VITCHFCSSEARQVVLGLSYFEVEKLFQHPLAPILAHGNLFYSDRFPPDTLTRPNRLLDLQIKILEHIKAKGGSAALEELANLESSDIPLEKRRAHAYSAVSPLVSMGLLREEKIISKKGDQIEARHSFYLCADVAVFSVEIEGFRLWLQKTAENLAETATEAVLDKLDAAETPPTLAKTFLSAKMFAPETVETSVGAIRLKPKEVEQS
jgi:hypothetical protein